MVLQPVIAIVGPTASGKTSLSITIAKAFEGEVISADSRQVYRGLDIGSGKVTKEEMADVPHYLLDVADPMETYTVSDFARDGVAALDNIVKRGHLPIIAGGSFFYVDTLLNGTTVPEVPPNESLRQELALLPTAELFTRLAALDQTRANTIDRDNPRRLIRAIEIATVLGHVPPTPIKKSPYRTLKLGIRINQDVLHHNIHVRLRERLEMGMVTETEKLLMHGITHARLEDLGLEYRYLSRYLRGDLSYETMISELENKIRQYAKRQMTWLKRDVNIHWVDKNNWSIIEGLVTDFLHPPQKA